MKKTLVLIFLGVCTSLTLLAFVNQRNGKSATIAATTICGQVVDKLTGEPLAGVCVTAGSHAVYTDFDGNFTVEQPVGSSLNVSLISYEAQQVQVNGSSLVVELVQ